MAANLDCAGCEAPASSDVPLQGLQLMLHRVLNSPVLHLTVVLAVLLRLFGMLLDYELRRIGEIGFAMDDAWIHMAIARNFVEGLGWGVNPGRTLSVSTSPTWTLLLAAAYWMVREPVMAALSVSFLCSMFSSILCYLFVLRLTGRAWLATLMPVVLMYTPITMWGLASGMEIPLVVATLLAALYLYHFSAPASRTRLIAVPIALAVAAVTRPELFMLIPLALLDTFYSLWRDKQTRKRAVWTLAVQALLVLIALSPYFAFNKISTGLLFPTTYYAKTRVRGIGIGAVIRDGTWYDVIKYGARWSVGETLEVANYFINANLVLFMLLVPGSLAFTKAFGTRLGAQGRLLPLAMFILPFAMGAATPARYMSNHADRYYAIFPVMAVLLAAGALDLLLRLVRARVSVAVCMLLILAAPWRTYPGTARLLLGDVDSTLRLYHAMGKWVNENIPPGAVIATNDIGVLGYFTKRDFIDIMGLSSPEIWPAISRTRGQKLDMNKVRWYLMQAKVDYLIVSPRYYPLLTNDTKVFEPIMEWSERIPHGRLISPQVIYRCHWDRAV